MLVFAAIMPHPPESIVGIGTSESFAAVARTMQSFDDLRVGLEISDPETIIIISPHGFLEPFSFMINSKKLLVGNFGDLGLKDSYAFNNNIEIADKIFFACNVDEEIPCQMKPYPLDYGALIPLYHLTKNIKPKVVHLSFSLMDYQRHYRYGEIIQKIIENPKSGRVAVIASGDLSHRLTLDALSGFSPKALEFDQAILHYLSTGDLENIMRLDPEIVDEVRECGMRSIVILLGILHGREYEFDLLSYEAPFGIGYMTARLVW